MKRKLKPKTQNLKPISGQSLMEILLAVTIGVIMIGAAAVAIVPMLRSNLETRTAQVATALIQEYLDNVRVIAESNWQNVYNPPASKGPSSQFYLTTASTTFALVSGTTSTIAEGKTFTRYFSIENANRDLCGAGDITTNSSSSCTAGPGTFGVADDPSTQKITVTVTWDSSHTLSRTQYLTRSRNKIFDQTDWSDGPGQEGPITSENNQFATSSNINYATTTGSIKIQGF